MAAAMVEGRVVVRVGATVVVMVANMEAVTVAARAAAMAAEEADHSISVCSVHIRCSEESKPETHSAVQGMMARTSSDRPTGSHR